MINTSLMEMNFTSVPISFSVCVNSVHAGMVVAYVLLVFCFFVGTPGHSWLLWLFLCAGWKIKPTQVFPLNLTIFELMYSIGSAFDVLNGLIFKSDTLWSVSIISFGLSWPGRPLIQVCISVEQYLAVIKPVMFVKYKELQYRIVFAAVVWLMAVACCLYEMFIDTFVDHFFNSVFFISVIIISFCCVSVLRALKQQGPGDTQIPMERGRERGNQQKRKAFNTIFSGLLIILFTYFPQILVSLINVDKTNEELFYCSIVPAMNAINFLGVIITPVVKIYMNGDMKCLTHLRQIKENS